MENDLLYELKCKELAILKQVVRVCDELGLKYYLLDGTMLGAVRHQGFIPWDDDIDIGMPRKDYDIFLAKAQTLLPEHLFLQNLYTDPKVLMNYSKVRDSSTTFIESAVKNRDINQGIYIDVFPLDYYPENVKTQKKLSRKKKVISRRIYREYTLPAELRQHGVKNILLKLSCAISTIRYPNTREALLERETLYKCCSSGGYLANHGDYMEGKEIVPAEWYGEGVLVPFEDLTVRIPTEYHKWLTQVYGDYMQLPPPEKRFPHHYTEVIDPFKPYTEYLDKRIGGQKE